MTKTVYGDGAIEYCNKNNIFIITRGNIDALHTIFSFALKHGAKTLKHPHPLNVHKRVLDALDRDERFEKYFITYPGIINRPCRAFKLIRLYKNGK